MANGGGGCLWGRNRPSLPGGGAPPRLPRGQHSPNPNDTIHTTCNKMLKTLRMSESRTSSRERIEGGGGNTPIQIASNPFPLPRLPSIGSRGFFFGSAETPPLLFSRKSRIRIHEKNPCTVLHNRARPKWGGETDPKIGGRIVAFLGGMGWGGVLSVFRKEEKAHEFLLFCLFEVVSSIGFFDSENTFLNRKER